MTTATPTICSGDNRPHRCTPEVAAAFQRSGLAQAEREEYEVADRAAAGGCRRRHDARPSPIVGLCRVGRARSAGTYWEQSVGATYPDSDDAPSVRLLAA
jgi:hypothetical protein